MEGDTSFPRGDDPKRALSGKARSHTSFPSPHALDAASASSRISASGKKNSKKPKQNEKKWSAMKRTRRPLIESEKAEEQRKAQRRAALAAQKSAVPRTA
jgi:hypothetical protein